MKHNEATGDNVGPLIVSVPKSEVEESSGEVAEKDDKKVLGRKKRVVVGYKTTALAYLVVSFQLARQYGLNPFSAYVLSSNVLAAGVSNIMVSAAENDRLSSDTYKRLNLGLVGYGMIGLVIQLLAPSLRTTSAFIAAYLAMINSIKGYSYGVLGWDKKNKDTSLVKDLMNYPAGIVKRIFSIPNNMKSFGYLGATGMVGGMKIAKLIELIKMIKEGADGMLVATRLSRFARLSFLAMTFYTLKDAADRDRLEGTTFIELNFLASLCMATMSAYVGFNTRLGGFAAFFSAFSAFNGLASIQKKRNKV